MAWNTEATKQKIKDAARILFAKHGPDGTTVERIAHQAGVNKERVYNYFGDKKRLFAAVLGDELAQVAGLAPVTSFAVEDIGEYAGRVYDYHREHPELIRLLRWEALAFEGEVPDEPRRQTYYAHKTAAVLDGQTAGTISDTIDAAHLALFVLSIAGWSFTVPQVARMMCGEPTEAEHQKRRAAVVTAARRLAGVSELQ